MRKPLLISLFLFFCMLSQGLSTTVYWNSTSATGSDLAGNASAWSTGVAPTTGSNVIFDSTSVINCTWDLSVALGNFSIETGYTGTITNAPSTDWSAANYAQADGTFTGDASSNLTAGNLTYSGGTITANTLNLIIDSPANISNTNAALVLGNLTANANVTVSGTQSVGAQAFYQASNQNLTISSGGLTYAPVAGSVFSNLGTIAGPASFTITTSGSHVITFGNIYSDVSLVFGEGHSLALGDNTVLGSGLYLTGSGTSPYTRYTFDSGGYNLTAGGAFTIARGWPAINQNQTWNIGGGMNFGDGATAYPYNPALTQKGNINTTYFSWIPYMGSSGYAGTFTGDSSFNLTLSDNFTFPDSACYYSGACGMDFSWPNINLVMTGAGKTLAFRPATPTNLALNSLTVLGDVTLLNTILTMNNLTIAGSLNLSGNRAVSAVNLTLSGSGKLNILAGSLADMTLNSTRFWANGSSFAISILSSVPSDGSNAVNLGKYLNISDLGAGVFDLNVSYAHSELGAHLESSLGVYRYTGSGWALLPSAVDPANDIVYASSIATFGPIALMSDITIPNLDNFKFSVPNITDYSPTQGYQFNATATDGMAVDDVWIEHNFTGTLTNYTVSTKVGDEYYYDYGTLGAGFYYMKWYANCTAGALNSSDWAHYYQIGKADPNLTLTAGPNATITYGTSLTVTGDAITICPQEFANVATQCRGLGTGGYSYSGNGVDSNAFDGDWNTLSGVGSDANLFINYTQPAGTLNATLKYKVLYDNGTNETVSAALPAPCVNSSLVSIWMRVNWRYILYCLPYDGTYGDLLTYHQFSYTGDTWSGGLYEENITWFYAPLNSLYKNGTLVASPYTAILGAGDYNFTWNTTGNQNYTENSTSILVTVNKADLPISLYVNGTDGDISVFNNSAANFSANFTSGYSFPITLYTNLTGAMELWDTQNSPLVNYTGLSPYPAGAYRAVANWTGNENYTYSQANHSLSLQETVILAQFAYPADATTNSTHRTIEFAWNATFYGGDAVNCSLWTNHTGSWMFVQANTSAVINNAINTLYYSYLIDYPDISWSVQCYDSTNRMNFTGGNRTLNIALNRNSTAINIIFPASVYQNSENRIKANITDLMTNLSVTFGTMSINLTKADSTSIKENMTYNGSDGSWLSGNHTFDVLGVWTLVLDYYGENLFGNSTNSSNVTVNAVPAAVSSVGGGGGGSNCYYNWTCSEWTPASCPASETQTRQCVNTGTCSGSSGKPPESQSCEYTPLIPEQLLDVVLSIDNNALSNSSDLVAAVSFTSFGREPANISTTYRVFDEAGKVVYTSYGHVLVYTEKLETVYFKDLELPAGDYGLELEIDYFNVTDRFKQEFRVIGSSLVTASAEALNIPGMVLIVVAALGLAGAIYLIRPPGGRGPLEPSLTEDEEAYPLPPLR